MIFYKLALNALCKITNENDLYKFIFVKSLKENVIKVDGTNLNFTLPQSRCF